MPNQVSLDVAGIVSVCSELLFYGVFLLLFIAFVYISVKRQRTRTTPSKVFLIGSFLMFVIATTHIGLNMYRLLRGYVFLRDTVGPVSYFNDLGRWDNLAHDLVNAMMAWTGDALAIYRSYIVWDNSILIIVIPVLLVIASIVSNLVALYMFAQIGSGGLFSPSLVHWMNTLYAVALVQNVYTTGFIAYRVWKQEQASVEVGLRGQNDSASLIPIVRIVIESAALYTLSMIVTITLYALKHNGQYVLQETNVAIVGIIFMLMTVRLALRSAKAVQPSTTGRAPGTLGIAWAIPSGLLSTTGDSDPTTTNNESHEMSKLEAEQLDDRAHKSETILNDKMV